MSRYQNMFNFFNGGSKKPIIILSPFVTILILITLNIDSISTSNTFASGFASTLPINDTNSEPKINYGLMPSNISIHVEPKDTGTLYFSASISNNTVDITRNLNDELFPFQIVNWYQLVKLDPRYNESFRTDNFANNNLIVGELKDFDNFDDLLKHSKLYKNVPINETFILDVPNRDVSFMQLKIDFTKGNSAIYYGLYDGNQEPHDKSEVHLRLNPESSLKIPESEPASDIKNDLQLFNVTKTFVCNDLFKLGYDKCK